VDGDGYVIGERLPLRASVAGPDEAAEALDAGRRVAVQRERTVVRTVELRTLPIHAVPIQPGGAVEAVALIGPEAVDAVVHHTFVKWPVARCLSVRWPLVVRRSARRQRFGRAWVFDRAGERSAF